MIPARAVPALPLVAVGYGPRCVQPIRLAEAATGICDLLWLVDLAQPEMREMAGLLGRFGAVADVSGLGVREIESLVAGHGARGIVTYLDEGMVDYAIVADRLDLAFNAPAAAAALVDKALQRRRLGEAGLPVPKCAVLGRSPDTDAIEAFGAQPTWPAVLKPRSAQGSRFTYLARSSADATRYLAALGPRRPEMILEEYLHGDPRLDGSPFADYVSVESVVSAGAISHLALTGRFPPAGGFRETGFFIPAVLEPDDRDGVLAVASTAIAALGVTAGCLHTEVKLTPDGPRIIEVNGRVGGGVHEMLGRAAGISILEITLRLALGEDVRVEGPVETSRVGYRFFLQPPGISATVGAIDGIDAVADHPSVDSVSIHQGPGCGVDWKDGSRNHILAVAGAARDYEELLEVDRLVRDRVTVTYASVAR